MKAKNYKEVKKGYWQFTIAFSISVILGIFLVYCFIHTSQNEFEKIEKKTSEYDLIYTQQLSIADRVDSLYAYLSWMRSDNKLNQSMLQCIVSNRKMQLLEKLQSMEAKDVLIYTQLLSQVNNFLQVKGDIYQTNIDEGLVKNDLLRCVEDNKKAARKLILGNITVEKK